MSLKIIKKRLPAVPNKPELFTDIGFIIEDSSTINDGYFTTLKGAVHEAIKCCTLPGARFFIISASAAAPLIISATTDKKEDLFTNLQKYNRLKLKPSTTTHKALKIANDMFRRDVSKKLFVFTEGNLDKQQLLIEQSIELKKKEVQVIGIGVGNLNIEKLKEWCSFNQTFSLNDFASKTKELLTPLGKKSIIYEYEIRMTVYALNYPVGFGKDLQLEIELTNVGEKDIPANTSILIIENDYFDSIPVFFKEPIEINGNVSTKVKLPAKGLERAIKIPEYLEFGVHHKSVSLHCKEIAFKLYSEFFIKDIIEAKPPIEKIPYLNILCFGVSGSGKSSFINSLMTALNEEIVRVAAVGGNFNHTTTTLSRFPIKDLEKEHLVSVPINLFDIWGMDAENFQNKMFLDVLKGKLPEGYKMKDRTMITKKMQEEILKEANWSQAERTIHSVIFFMPYNIDDNPKFTEALAENFRICTKDNKMNPVVVVTRSSYEGDLYAQEQLKLRISNKFNIPANQIFMFDNYTTQTEKTMSIDRMTLEVLSHTINSAITYQKFYKSILLEVLDQKVQTARVRNSYQIPSKNSDSPQTVRGKPKTNRYSVNVTYTQKISAQQKTEFPTLPPLQSSGNNSQSSGLTCKKCHEEVEADWGTCPSCTTPIEIPKPLNISNSSNTCACGKSLKPNWISCPYCKKSVPVAVVGPKKCVCGEEIEDESWEVCPVCDIYLKRPSICCNVPVRPNFLNCPKCKKIFPK